MKREVLAGEIITLAGGVDNIKVASHCMTRLRIRVKDDAKINVEGIKKLEGVLGLVVKEEEYQIIIGQSVGKVYDEVIKITGFKEQDMVVDEETRKQDAKEKKKASLGGRLLDTIAGIFIPAIGLIAGGGVLKGFLAVFVQFGLLQATSGTYITLYALGDSVFYFFPIIIGYNAGKKFGGNPIISAGLGCALIYPTILTAVSDATALTLFCLPLKLINYTQSVLPIIFISFVAVKLEKLFKKVLPDVMQVIFVPMFTLVVAGSLGFLVIGPVVTALGNGIAFVVNSIYGASPVLTGFVMGGIWQLAILAGIQWGLVPIFIQNITTLGYCPVMATLACTVFGQVGAAIAAGVKSKNKKYKSIGIAAGVAGILGVSEPAIYGINVPAKKPFFIALGASAIGGFVAAAFGAKQFVPGGAGIFALPGMINPQTGLDTAFWGVVLSCIVSLILAFILTALFGIKNTCLSKTDSEIASE